MSPGLREALVRFAVTVAVAAVTVALVAFFALVVLRPPACTDPADPLYRLECRL